MESKQIIPGILRVVVVCLAAAGLASGQAAPPRAQMAEEVFKNIQVLKGIPVDEFMDTMGMFSASLSMNCTDCHTEESTTNWEKFAEETLPKRTARRTGGKTTTELNELLANVAIDAAKFGRPAPAAPPKSH
jgi:hypothetical protein